MPRLLQAFPWTRVADSSRKDCADLQDLGQLLAALQLQRGLADALVARLDLLCLLLQSGLKVQAAQADLVLWD